MRLTRRGLVGVPIIFFLLGAPASQAQTAQAATTVHPPVEIIQATAPDASVLKARKGSYSYTISSGDWTNTGVVVIASAKVMSSV